MPADLSIDIAIPAYKPTWFRECLRSALEQTYPIRKVLIADDRDDDQIREIVAEFNDARIRYHKNHTRQGLVGNYCRLAQLSDAQWLKYLDDDDILVPDAVENLASIVHANDNIAIVFGNSLDFFEGERPVDQGLNLPECIPGAVYFLDYYPRIPITLFSRILIRTTIVDAFNPLQIDTGMISFDELIGLLSTLEGNVGFQRKPVCKHRLNPIGYSKISDVNLLKRDLDFILIPYRAAKESESFPRKALERWKFRMLHKAFRGTYAKLLKEKNYPGFEAYYAFSREISAGAARRSLLNMKVLKRFLKYKTSAAIHVL
jgi:glycosyltransferase involved in cell wall biosynthesis